MEGSINGGIPPVIIHFSGIFHEINQPAIKGTPILGNPHMKTSIPRLIFGYRLGLNNDAMATRPPRPPTLWLRRAFGRRVSRASG